MTHVARDALQLSGLFLEGAAWDPRTAALTDPPPRSGPVPLPVVCVRPVPAESVQSRGQYWCPLYANRSRGDTFLQLLNLRTVEPQTKWIMRGACAVLDDAPLELLPA